jgi:hypothetical protein
MSSGREERRKRRQLPGTTVAKLSKAGSDPKELFASLGFASPTELAKLDDARLASEVQRLCTSLARKPTLRALVSWNLRFYARKIESRLRQIAWLEAAMAAAPKKARERVKRWNAALAKFRDAATRAGVKIRGL